MSRQTLALIFLICGAVLFFTGAVAIYLTCMLIGAILGWIS